MPDTPESLRRDADRYASEGDQPNAAAARAKAVQMERAGSGYGTQPTYTLAEARQMLAQEACLGGHTDLTQVVRGNGLVHSIHCSGCGATYTARLRKPREDSPSHHQALVAFLVSNDVAETGMRLVREHCAHALADALAEQGLDAQTVADRGVAEEINRLSDNVPSVSRWLRGLRDDLLAATERS